MGDPVAIGLEWSEVLMITRNVGLDDDFVLDLLPEMDLAICNAHNEKVMRESKAKQGKIRN